MVSETQQHGLVQSKKIDCSYIKCLAKGRSREFKKIGVPLGELTGVRLAAHSDNPPTPTMR
jgi:D-mannonate dehydratase